MAQWKEDIESQDILKQVMKNKVNRRVTGFFWKRGLRLDEFPFELSLSTKRLHMKRPSHRVKAASEDAMQSPPDFCLGSFQSVGDTGCLQPTHCRALSSRLPRGAGLSWCGRLCLFHVTWRKQSQREDSLEAFFCLFVLTMCVEHEASDALGWTYYFQFLLNICSPVKNIVWIQKQNKAKQKSLLRWRILFFCKVLSPLKSPIISGLTVSISILDSHFQRNLSLQNLFCIKLPFAAVLCPISETGKLLRTDHLMW